MRQGKCGRCNCKAKYYMHFGDHRPVMLRCHEHRKGIACWASLLTVPEPVELPKLSCFKCQPSYDGGVYVNTARLVRCDCGGYSYGVTYQPPEGTTGQSEAKEEREG